MKNEWKETPLNKLFDIQMGTKLDFSKMTFDKPEISFVGRSGFNNGNNKQKVDLIDGVKPYLPGNITVALGGSIGSTFLQDEPFYTSQNVAVLVPKKRYKMNRYHKLFIITLLKYQFSLKFVAFGRELNRYIRNDINVVVPYLNNKINWRYMEQKTKNMLELEREKLKKYSYKDFNIELDLKKTDWQKFKMDSLFKIETVKYYQAKTLYQPGKIPFITQTAMNNGVETYVDKEMFELEKGNCVIIGSIGITAFYQEKDFLSDLKIYKIYGDVKKGSIMNKEVGLFISTVLNKEQFKYGYGRQFYLNNLKNTEIMLPSKYNKLKESYEPDWEFIVNYIKMLTNNVINDFIHNDKTNTYII